MIEGKSILESVVMDILFCFWIWNLLSSLFDEEFDNDALCSNDLKLF